MITTILTDIEGTTSSISFVKDVLFPFARKRLPAFIVSQADDPAVQHWLHEAAKEANLISASQQEMIDLLQQWIDQDRKATSLKALQGMIWEEGYRTQEFRAHIYEDAVRCLRHWYDEGFRLYLYSSGSVTAQKLFFEHTEAGDLTRIFSGYFDTEIGPKRAAASYLAIAKAIGEAPQRILFLSDIKEELDAAHEAGMMTFMLCRSPSLCEKNCGHRCGKSFDEIKIIPTHFGT